MGANIRGNQGGSVNLKDTNTITSDSRFSNRALLILEDGEVYEGRAFGAVGTTIGEIVFSTGMTGYQETLTDPSYARQIVVQTFPHIGNTGVNDQDGESDRIWVAGYVVREPSPNVSNWRPGAVSMTSWSIRASSVSVT